MASPKAYVVQHTMVGVHAVGDVITFTEDHIKNGVDLTRLVALGALREATGDEAKDAVEYGTDTDITPLFPPVPFQPAAHQEVPQPKRPDETK